MNILLLGIVALLLLGFILAAALVVLLVVVPGLGSGQRKDQGYFPAARAASAAPAGVEHADAPDRAPDIPLTPAGRCPQCGADLPADSPEGLCPPCLLRAGVDSAADLASGSRTPRTTPHPGPGATAPPAELAAHFPQLEVLELLGQGGMGTVYRARQPHLDRLVALKILPSEAGQDPAFVERFTREARALARLSHPHIVAVHDFGQADGLYYLLMEYVDGVNLRQLLEAGPLEPRQALLIVPQICDALHYAHSEGVVHRDIKPENILLDRKGRVKIADFGLAKLLGRAPAEFTLTSARQVMGTLHYMAPEQMERPLEVDHRADIYSLGVVFYEMLTHELPLGRFAPPSERAPVDVRLDDVVLRALEKEPQKRYQHASDVKTDVEAIVTGPTREQLAPAVAARKAAAVRPRKPRGSVPITLLVLVLALPLCCVPLGLVGAGLFFFGWVTPVRMEQVGPVGGQEVYSGAGTVRAIPPGEAMISFAARGDDVTGFLASGVSPNATDENGTTALMAAARNGHLKTVQALLDKGAAVNWKDKSGKTALDYARQNRHEDVVAALRAKGGR